MTQPLPRIDQWLTISMLRLLVGIEDHGSLSKGARAAGLIQSNASRTLKTLERRLGYPLIQRSPRGSTLTQHGKLTVEWARDVLNAVDTMAAGMEALGQSDQHELSIGTSMTVAEHLLPGWISAFRRHRPGVTTKLQVMNSSAVIEAVQSHNVVLGFIETPVIPEALRSARVWRDDLVPVVGTDHPWARQQEPLTAHQLSQTHLIEREEGSGTRAFLDHLVGSPRPQPLLELNNNAAICQAVIEGIGPAVLSRLVVEDHLRAGQLVPIAVEDQKLERSLHAIWDVSATLTDAGRDFLHVCRSATLDSL